jgi:ketosteroid isomerase-like protein
MSQENVEVVKAGFAAWNAGDMDAFGELYHPDAILRAPEGWPEQGPFVGREAVMDAFKQFRKIWDADTIELGDDFIDVGDTIVLKQVIRSSVRGLDSTLEWTFVVTLRERRILIQEIFWDHAEALEAAGISE